MYLLLSSDNFSSAVESTYIGGNFVQVVKPTIVASAGIPFTSCMVSSSHGASINSLPLALPRNGAVLVSRKK